MAHISTLRVGPISTPQRQNVAVRRPAWLIGVAVATVVAGVVIVLFVRSRGPRYHDTRGAQVRQVEFQSRLLGRSLDEVEVAPAGERAGRPLLVLLHGRGMGPEGLLSDAFFSGLRRLGGAAPVVVIANGGDHSYYHDRQDGPWGSYVLHELIPWAIGTFHADGQRVAIGGVSMGGFGALDLARLAPGRFCAVGGHSAALWEAAGQTPSGAFDDAADFGRHDVFRAARGRHRPYGRARMWLDVGSDDPFRAADTAFVSLLRRDGEPVAFHVWPGSHNSDYWDVHMAAYLRFYAQVLAACGQG